MVGGQSAGNIGIDTNMSTHGSGEAYRHSSGTESTIWRSVLLIGGKGISDKRKS